MSLRLALSAVAVLLLVASAQSETRLLLLDDAHLASVRARIDRGDEGLRRSLAALERDASGALALKPPSVMDKSITPPSGDKHDYMSLAPYWWPDPSKPDGRPYIRRDGERNPEINRDHRPRHLGAASTAPWRHSLSRTPHRRRADYAAHAARLVRVWFLDPPTRMNPHFKFGQGIPGINEGRGIGIIETSVLPHLSTASGYRDGGRMDRADQAGLEAWLRSYLTWMLESSHGHEEAVNEQPRHLYDVQVASLALFRASEILRDVPSRAVISHRPPRSSRTAGSRASWSGPARGTTAPTISPPFFRSRRLASAPASICGGFVRRMAGA